MLTLERRRDCGELPGKTRLEDAFVVRLAATHTRGQSHAHHAGRPCRKHIDLMCHSSQRLLNEFVQRCPKSVGITLQFSQCGLSNVIPSYVAAPTEHPNINQ